MEILAWMSGAQSSIVTQEMDSSLKVAVRQQLLPSTMRTHWLVCLTATRSREDLSLSIMDKMTSDLVKKIAPLLTDALVQELLLAPSFPSTLTPSPGQLHSDGEIFD